MAVAYTQQLNSLKMSEELKTSDELVELEQSLAEFYMDLGLFSAARCVYDRKTNFDYTLTWE